MAMQLKVEKLIGVRRLLKRLEFIFDLPQRLNTCVFKLVIVIVSSHTPHAYCLFVEL